jgi:hypothetical protein
MKAAQNDPSVSAKKALSQSEFMTEYHRKRREANAPWFKKPKIMSDEERLKRSNAMKEMWRRRKERNRNE